MATTRVVGFQTGDDMTIDRKAFLRAFIRDVWDEGRVDLVPSYLAPAYRIVHDPGDPWHGMTLDQAAFQDRVRQSRAPFPDQCFAIQALFDDGEGVAMTWLWAATHLGDMPGFPASGRRITMSGATVYLFDDADRLTGHWQVADRLSVFQQLQANRSAS